MDGQQYLQQISESNRPVAKGGKKGGIAGIVSSKFFLIGAIGLGALIVIMIIGSALGGNRTGVKGLSYELKLHLDYTAEVVQEYQQYVKSSELRSNSASLNGVLTNTSRDLTGYLEEKYDFKDRDISKTMEEEAELAQSELNNELFEAKINGILDRIFAHKMAYEISLFLAEEDQLASNAGDETLTGLLVTSSESLENLYNKFNEFSETKN